MLLRIIAFMIEVLILFSTGLYALEYLLAIIGGIRSRNMRSTLPDELPNVTVVVAARNEEKWIRECLDSIMRQDYPSELLQVIAINDESEDATLEIMNDVSAQHSARLTVLSAVTEDTPIHGKARAIAQAIDHATGELIIMTDADCTVPVTWVRGVVGYFEQDIDALGSFPIVKSTDVFSAVQQLDWLHLHSLASAAIGLRAFLGIIGNNTAFRKRTYDQAGGYRNIKFSVTEDYALFKTIVNNGGKLLFPCDPNIAVETHPCPKLSDVVLQKQRWARGGSDLGFPGYSVLVLGALMMTAFVVAPFVSLNVWMIAWGVKILVEFLVMTPNIIRLRKTRQLLYFPLFQFYFIVQVFLIPLLLLRRDVVWKGRIYKS